MKTEANEPAFAGNEYDHGQFNPGLSKREMLAAMALQGILANNNQDSQDPSNVKYNPELAVRYADALIKELNNTSEN